MRKLKQFFCGLFIATFMIAPAVAAQNVSRTAVNTERARAIGTAPTQRVKQPGTAQRSSAPRANANVVSRSSARTAVTKPRVQSTSRVSRVAHILSDAGDVIIRRALGLGRTATNTKTISRSATRPAARSAVAMGPSRARATAVFSDVSKMGEGYTRCRESYNTCMDQFCANMNETYRRCYCSNNYRNLRDKEDALNTATTMLAKFEDNNLNAVNKSADEVAAMYSATEGESAIKKDTSGAAALLDEIGDLLSGKKKAADAMSMTSLTGLSIDFSSDLGDIWGNNDSIFGTSAGPDLTELEGLELYTNAHNQCIQVVAGSCENAALKNMAKSAYSVLVTQDCNAYQKTLDKKTETVKQTVRQAEKMLREARLEDYRSHNSADVNECMDKVEQAMLAPTACGPDYAKCMDYTGSYINTTTGEAIYSPRLFKLNEIIALDGVNPDVLGQNVNFNNFLDSKRMFANSALDSCRGIAETVWTEFKRNALIKIAQAQDEKLEEVKMSCVSTMKECYDTQGGALKGFDDTTAKSSGALAARAAKDMCVDKVVACAALYAGETDEQCHVDPKTNRITNTDRCGLKSLLDFVDNVDDTRIAEGCGIAIENYLKELCTPTSGDMGYPWNCRLRKFAADSVDISIEGLENDAMTEPSSTDKTLKDLVVKYAYDNCGIDTMDARIKSMIATRLVDLHDQLTNSFEEQCAAVDGIWISSEAADAYRSITTGATVERFYINTFGKTQSQADTDYGVNAFGTCAQDSVRLRCESINAMSENGDWATWDAAAGRCRFTLEYYKQKCNEISGIWSDGVCYVNGNATQQYTLEQYL